MAESTEGNQDGNDFSRVLPDPNICRTRPIGEIRSFAMCLVSNPSSCLYAMSYGSSYLCRHPQWQTFVKP